ncbi:hypothetical protein Tasa_045_001 [Tanticharoenia sakaeratensis NBRC 103193]|uniref:Uncharacterized protein n=1 Tax=Tanticharoenia sakaeratensis NBRC 103193 TaxID=1231623 RepID=A0A0D6MNQ2_9PROT|nr:hypothetical protein Tasa_045_001 [Tanticharoenia sakaeratensis NBRC 103193]GBQ25462.1 hypothetical protein AA103193_3094 [Tanticharoenia sakaeratensis NBRC 103193]
MKNRRSTPYLRCGGSDKKLGRQDDAANAFIALNRAKKHPAGFAAEFVMPDTDRRQAWRNEFAEWDIVVSRNGDVPGADEVALSQRL